MAKVRIVEVRKLMLPFETAVDAVLELDRSHGGTLGTSKLLEARVETGADPALVLIVARGAGDAEISVEKRYTIAAVAAAAIHYCFRVRIPLPRQAVKSIEVTPEGFQLTIQTQTEVARLHGEAPKITQSDGVVPTARAQDSGTAAAPVEAVGDAALNDPTQDAVSADAGNPGEVAGAAEPQNAQTAAA